MTPRPVGDGVCKTCDRGFCTIYRGGICISCTKRLTGAAQAIMETKDVRLSKFSMAANSRRFLIETDTVRRLSA